MSKMGRILIADDHSIVRLGASIIIKEAIKNAVIVQTETYDEIYAYIEKQPFDILLLDINMPGGNNIKVIKKIKEIQEDIKILIFSSYDENIYALRYIEAGACGYLNKTTAMGELKHAIECIQNGSKYMSPSVKDLYIQKLTTTKASIDKVNPLNKLSNREMDVAKLLIQGLGVLEVSNILNVSSSTVSTYKSRVFEKLGVNNIPNLLEIFHLHSEDI